MDIRRGVAEANGIELAYEDMGDVLHPPILLIMGLSAQLTLWPLGFCELLVKAGYRVIRFDNRDIGLSTKLSHLKVSGPVWKRFLRAQLGLPSPVPYTLHDMAEDVRGLLDFLQIPSAHVVGASMGGMRSGGASTTFFFLAVMGFLGLFDCRHDSMRLLIWIVNMTTEKKARMLRTVPIGGRHGPI